MAAPDPKPEKVTVQVGGSDVSVLNPFPTSGSGGGAATIADGADVAQGALADAAVLSDASGSLSAKLRGLVKWAAERMPASLGQKTKAASLPVTLASDEDAIAIASGPTGVNTLRVQGMDAKATPPTGRPVLVAGEDTDGDVRHFKLGTNGNMRVDIDTPLGKDALTAHVHQPAANTAAVVTLAAPGAGVRNVLGMILFGYDGDPTGGSITVEDGVGNTVAYAPVTAGGPGPINFTPPLKGDDNGAVIITLAAGGAGVTGSVCVHAWTE